MMNMTWVMGSMWGPAILAGLVAFAAALLLVMTQHLHGHFSIDTHVGVQKFHTDPTPRIGGVAIACGVVVGKRDFCVLAVRSGGAIVWRR